MMMDERRVRRSAQPWTYTVVWDQILLNPMSRNAGTAQLVCVGRADHRVGNGQNTIGSAHREGTYHGS
jgi:hypothetical protein